MRVKQLFFGMAIGAILTAAAYSLVLAERHSTPRRRLFLYDRETISGPAASVQMLNRVPDIREICPDTLIVFEREKADYSQSMFWIQNHWRAVLTGDSALLLAEETPDFNKIIRDVCKAIREDQKWPSRSLEQKNNLLDRYELRDLRNGNVSTSAMLDKQTGKVWVWKNITRDGKATGKTAFLSEEVSPRPDDK
jgi:gas vesicle protein